MSPVIHKVLLVRRDTRSQPSRRSKGRTGWALVGLASLGAALLGSACGSDESSFVATSGGTSTGGPAGGAPTGPTTSTTTSTSVGGAGGAGGSAPACENKTAVPGERTYTIDFDGNQREYDVQVPLSYDGATALPLVFDFHGYSSTKGQQKLVSGFSELAEDAGFIVVRTSGFGLLRSWNAGDVCCGQAQSTNLDDVGLVRAIVSEVSATACVDAKRIYATGLSNGGALSHRLACEAADVFAAVAPVSYPLDRDPFSQCQPSRPIAVMHAHGRSDLIVPYDGSITQPSTPESFAFWAASNGCTGSPTETYSNNNSSCKTYETCSAGVQTTLCTVDGGHVLYANNDDVPIAELSWQFLSAHTLP